MINIAIKDERLNLEMVKLIPLSNHQKMYYYCQEFIIIPLKIMKR